MRLIDLFLFVLPSVLLHGSTSAAVDKSTVLVCYGKLDPALIKGYHYVILESQHYNIYEIRKIKSQNEKVLAYISLGEVNANAPHFAQLKASTLGKNDIWDSYYLDLKQPQTSKTLLSIMQNTLALGYDGFFLDNIDNYTSFGTQPQQKAELIDLLKLIRTSFPDKVMLQNAGLELVPETAALVNAVIIESIATNYTFNDKKYKLREEADFQNYVTKLNNVSQHYNLPVILIEYADTAELRDAVRKRIKNLGFEYFIGQIDLQELPKFSEK